MLENYMYNPEIMKRVSKHYQSGEPLPEEMLQGLISKQNANLAIGASSTS
jgi:metallopeptidase MepB